MLNRKFIAVLLSLSLAVPTAGLTYSTEVFAEENAVVDGENSAADTESAATDESNTAADTESTESEENLTEADLDGNCVDGEIIIVYEDEGLSDKKSEKLQDSAEEDLKEDCDIEVVEEITDATKDEGTVVKAEIQDDSSVAEAIEDAESIEGVAYAQPNYAYKLVDELGEDVTDETELAEETSDESVATASSTGEAESTSVNDKYASACYYLTDANITTMWDSTKTNGSQTVAVFDTGCNYTHPDLKNNVLTQYAYDAYHSSTVSGTVNTMTKDYTGHGTHVCGLIAAEADNSIGIAGTSYNAKILPIKVFDDKGEYTTTAALSRAFKRLETLVKGGYVKNCHVLNLSLGFVGSKTNDTTTHNWIKKMKSTYNILTVAAGGNTGTTSTSTANSACYPADWSECLSVAWHNSSDEYNRYSDKNRYKDISAPGVGIASLGTTYQNGSFIYNYVTMSGSSMATPIVSGVCAALFASNPSATASQVYNAIKQSGSTGFTFSDTHGSYSIKRLNASAAVPYLKYAPTTMSLKSLSKASKAFTAKWKAKSGNVSGYQITYATNSYYNSATTVTVDNPKATSRKISGLSKKKKYYVKIRAYYTVNGKNYYSAWSATKTVKTK